MRHFRIWTLAVFLLLPQLVFAAGWKWIAPQRVHNLVKEGSSLWIVDVRTSGAFEQGHIEGAVNIPAEQLKVKNLPKSKLIVLADDSLGLRNARAGADAFVKKGYEKVFILEGGIPAWQGDGLPITGKRSDNLRPVMWDDLTWTRTNSVQLRLYDLRDKDERTKGPVDGAKQIAGRTLDERLKAVTTELRTASKNKGLAGKLEKPMPMVLVLPLAPQSLEEVRKAFRGLPGDFRYLEGAYPLWVAREKKNPLPGPEVCPVCPGGRAKK